MVFIGCEVHAYDPTVNLSKQNISFNFYNHSWVWHNDDTSSNRKTLGSLIDANGHRDRHITMLKMDVEGSEIRGIDAWLKQGSLDNVNQIAIEYHLLGGK